MKRRGDRQKNSIIFTKKGPKNSPLQFSFWKKTIGQADENKELFSLKKVFLSPETTKLASKRRHLSPQYVCYCTAKACLLACKSNAFKKTRLMRELFFTLEML
ncbi:hypothetical protein CJ231_09615 [Hoylesella buccalis]|uniref:Uncharacterized protein n=1 Tax=Hoylesella buccalis TaxID=28127 RepID=A0A2N6QPC8_9BACT|nr:hypothetical protein CJ231_09615 [Hoylesella buccalis]